MKLLVFLCALMMVIGGVAGAARRDNRQVKQRARITQGVKSGELTRKEAKKLRAQQRGIRRAEKRAEADGEVTAEEKARIEKRQDRASKNIYRQKHDDQKRGEDAPAPEALVE